MLCSFDPLANLFASITSDNRIKIWNAISGNLEKELTDPKHLSVKYCCISWPAEKVNTTPKKKAIFQNSLALGTEKGTVVVWNLKKGEISHTFDEKKDGHSAKVNDITFSSSGILFTCAEDGFFCQWDIQSGELLWKSKKKSESVKKLCINSNCTTLATASSFITVWDLSSKKVLKKFTAHSAPFTSISYSADDKYLITSSSDRFMYIWNCSDADSTASIQVLTCDSIPLSIDLNSTINQDVYYCTALSDSNVINFWSFTPTKKAKKPIGSQGTISSKSPIFGVKFCSPTQIYVAYGNSVKPTFQKLEFLSNRDIIKEQQLSTVSSNLLIQQQDTPEKEGKKSSNSTVIGNVNMPIPDLPMESLELQPGEARAQLSIQEKLESLGLTAPQKSSAIPKSDSVQTVLIQALHTKDSALLETCLEVADPTVIKNTVQSLPTTFVLPFVTFAVEKFRASPNRTEIIPWLRNVLIYHSSYLMSVPDVVTSLTALYTTIDTRVAALPRLLKLSGRLDLLLSQVSYSNTPAHYITASTVYEESSDDENERDEELNEEDADEDESKNDDMMDYDEED